MHLAAKVSSLY